MNNDREMGSRSLIYVSQILALRHACLPGTKRIREKKFKTLLHILRGQNNNSLPSAFRASSSLFAKFRAPFAQVPLAGR